MRLIEQPTEEILAFPNASRSFLAEKLVASLEFDIDIDPAIQAVWATEVNKRRDEVWEVVMQPISGEDALAQVR
jgi:hypothetical protein